MSKPTKTTFSLPMRIITRRDVLETIRELEEARDSLIAARVKSDDSLVKEPTQRLKALMEENDT